MKSFDSLQDLWSYAMYCPYCKDMSRKVSINIGPENKFKHLSDKKENQFLNLDLEEVEEVDADEDNLSISKSLININIDCCKNTFIVKSTPNPKFSGHVMPASFYLSLFAHCNECNSFINSDESVCYFENNKINLFEVSDESFFISDNDEFEYQIRYLHYTDKMYIKRYSKENYVDDDEKKLIKPVWCPIFDIDFHNIQRSINRIKTVLIFS